MEKLSAWIRKHGYALQLEPGADDEVECEGRKRVLLNSRPDRDSIVATALHECGHILIYEARCKQQGSSSMHARPIAGSNLRDYRTQKRRFATNTCKRKVAIITEEIEAWERGWELGRRLRIRLAKRKFENVRIKALMTYMRWGGRCKKGK